MTHYYENIVERGGVMSVRIEGAEAGVVNVFRGEDWDSADASTGGGLGEFFYMASDLTGNGVFSVNMVRNNEFVRGMPAYMSSVIWLGMFGQEGEITKRLAKAVDGKLKTLNHHLSEKHGYECC